MGKSHVLKINPEQFRGNLLEWYDHNRRVLPWRAKKCQKPNPYHVWLSEIMLQQTTVPAVKSYFEKFITLWPTIHDLAAADSERVMKEWAGLGYYARARNLLKCAEIVSNKLNGIFPEDESELKELPGIGPYTAAAISAIAYGCEAVVIDGNVERVVSRIFKIETPLPQAKKEISLYAASLYKGVGNRAADFPQALMDLGAMICTPKSPACGLCPVSKYCLARKNSVPDEYPKRQKKQLKPKRSGEVYWIETPKGIVIEKRPSTWMLGEMTGLPTTRWDERNEEKRNKAESFPLNPNRIGKVDKIGKINHVFTHFALTLDVIKIETRESLLTLKENQQILPINGIKEAGFPSLFEKVVSLVTGQKEDANHKD